MDLVTSATIHCAKNVRMWVNTDQNNSEYGHMSRNDLTDWYWASYGFYLSLRKILWFHLIFWCGNFVERHSFLIVPGDWPETMRKLCLSTKFSHQEIRWNQGIFLSLFFFTSYYDAMIITSCGYMYIIFSLMLGFECYWMVWYTIWKVVQ